MATRDFNASVGCRIDDNDDRSLGRFGQGERNVKDKFWSTCAMSHLVLAHSLFSKLPTRPDGTLTSTKNELSLIEQLIGQEAVPAIHAANLSTS